ncbi:MAG: organomercurial transporter MerC [Betaproteobacteria bacterium]|nr:organomercurial transporter MerC [Betaproteobacteria bacterium]
MEWITSAADRAGVVGTVVSAAACPACFPALASLGGAMGLGVFAEYEGLFMTTLLPLFAGIALVANALGWLRHRQWRRSALGMLGPAMVLAALLLFPGQECFATLLYAGVACMVGVSLWDLFSPANKRCEVDGCASSQVRS